ncbi:MAG: sugar ABC transporter ATP-binding protein [Rhodobacteraceae bacterium]|nr:sugar ABC transporter ATP-binding protein [Paracoccaceae bacterium]
MQHLSLKMSNITKKFPGVLALDNADFELAKGEVHALLGINGAGKSTLIKVLAGINSIDSGQIWVDGVETVIDGTRRSKELGIATVYQAPEMIPSFSGYENVFLGVESSKRGLFPFINRKALRKKANEVLEEFPIDIDLDKPISDLAPIEREGVAILRALVLENISILILDEPTSILSHREAETLFEMIAAMKGRGVSIIYITHNLEEVFIVSDRFTVFRNGRNVGTYESDRSNYSHNDVAELMLGDKMTSIYPDKSETIGDPLFSIRELSHGTDFQNVSIKFHEREIVGVFGLVGSGIDELCKTMFGDLRPDAGQITVKGKDVALKSCADAINEGIFLVPGDRHAEGYISDESVAFNVTLSKLPGISKFGFVNRKTEKNATLKLIDKLKIAPGDPYGNISKLSGGNQQKAVMAKGFYTESDIYIFQEPTVGVDVGAKALIYRAIRDLSETCATMVISSDCEEVYGIADRIVVIFEGKVVLNAKTSEVSLDDALVHGLAGGHDNV